MVPKTLLLTLLVAACIAASFIEHPLKCGDCVRGPFSVHGRYPALAADVCWRPRLPRCNRTVYQAADWTGNQPRPRCTNACIAAFTASAGRLPPLASMIRCSRV